MNQKQKTKHFYLILILGLLTAIGPFSIDMYLPAFPDIATHLHTSVSRVMLSLSGFFIGISVGQLFYGPLLERFGRKKSLYWGFVIYLMASIGCAFATSVNSLIVFRFIQALGGCAGMVAARAVVRDLFEVSKMAKVFSSLMLVIAISPIIAPTLGGYITAELGWRYVFAALIFLAIIILIGIYFILPESKEPDPGFSLKPLPIVRNFAGIFRNNQFSTYAFTSAIASSGLYAYISGSPFVFMKYFHVTEKHYGWIFAFIALGLIGASQVNNMVLKKYSSASIVRLALLIQCVTGVLLAIISYYESANLYTTIFLIFIFLSCQGFVFPNTSALSLAPFAKNAGSASAMMGAIQMTIGAVISALVSILQSKTAFAMTGVMAGCAAIALLVLLWGSKKITHNTNAETVEKENVEMIKTL